MGKLSRKELEELNKFSYEDAFGTDTIYYYEEYDMYLPYWVGYMSTKDRVEYINEIKKTCDWRDIGGEHEYLEAD